MRFHFQEHGSHVAAGAAARIWNLLSIKDEEKSEVTVDEGNETVVLHERCLSAVEGLFFPFIPPPSRLPSPVRKWAVKLGKVISAYQCKQEKKRKGKTKKRLKKKRKMRLKRKKKKKNKGKKEKEERKMRMERKKERKN